MTHSRTSPSLPPPRRAVGPAGAGLLLACTLALGACGGPPAPSPVTPTAGAPPAGRDTLTDALAAALVQQTGGAAVADRVAVAVTREAGRHQLEPSLLAGVLLTENSRLDSAVVSRSGAVGLMQVMRLHAGAYDCGSTNLRQIDSNVCHGAHILSGFMQQSPDVRQALLRYNGCVRRGHHARKCERYPGRVLHNASRIREAMRKAGDRQDGRKGGRKDGKPEDGR